MSLEQAIIDILIKVKGGNNSLKEIRRFFNQVNNIIDKTGSKLKGVSNNPLAQMAQGLKKFSDQKDKSSKKNVKSTKSETKAQKEYNDSVLRGIELAKLSAKATKEFNRKIKDLRRARSTGFISDREFTEGQALAKRQRDRSIIKESERRDPEGVAARKESLRLEDQRQRKIRKGIELSKTRVDLLEERLKLQREALTLAVREGKISGDAANKANRRLTDSIRKQQKIAKNPEAFFQKQRDLDSSRELFKSLGGSLSERVGELTSSQLKLIRQNSLELRREFLEAGGSSKKFERRLKGLGKALLLNNLRTAAYNSSNLRLAQTLSDVSSRLTTFGRSAIVAGVAIAGPALAGIKVFAEFEQATKNVISVLGELNTESGRQAGFNILADRFISLGERTEFTADQIADAGRQLGLAGFNLAEINSSVESIVNLASAGNVELELAARIAANIGRAFRIDTSNFERISDVLSTVATSSNTTVETLGESFKLLAPIASNLGQDLETVTSALGVLGNAGISASRAGTGLSRAFSELLEKEDDFRLVLESFGSSFEAIDPTRVGLDEIIREFERLQLTTEFSTKTFFDLFDQRSARVITTLVNQGSRAFDRLKESAEDSAGAAARIREARIDTVFGNFLKATSAARSALIEFGQTLAPTAEIFLKAFTNFIRGLTDFIRKNPGFISNIAKLTVAIGGLVTAIGAVSIAIAGITKVLAGGALFKFLREFGKAFFFSASAVAAETKALLANSVAREANARAGITGIGRTRGGRFATAAGRGASGGAFAGLTALAPNVFNPITLAIAGVVAALGTLAFAIRSVGQAKQRARLDELAEDFERTNKALAESSKNVSDFAKGLDVIRRLPSGNALDFENFVNLDLSSSRAAQIKTNLENQIKELTGSVKEALDSELTDFNPLTGARLFSSGQLQEILGVENGVIRSRVREIEAGLGSSTNPVALFRGIRSAVNAIRGDFDAAAPAREVLTDISSLPPKLQQVFTQIETFQKLREQQEKAVEEISFLSDILFGPDAEQQIDDALVAANNAFEKAQQELETLQLTDRSTLSGQALENFDQNIKAAQELVSLQEIRVDFLSRANLLSAEQLSTLTKLEEVSMSINKIKKDENLTIEEKVKLLENEFRTLSALQAEQQKQAKSQKEQEKAEKERFDFIKEREKFLEDLREKKRKREEDQETFESESLQKERDRSAEFVKTQEERLAAQEKALLKSQELQKNIRDGLDPERTADEDRIAAAQELVRIEERLNSNLEARKALREKDTELAVAILQEQKFLENERNKRLKEEREERELTLLNEQLTTANVQENLQAQLDLTKKVRDIEAKSAAEKLFGNNEAQKAEFIKQKELQLAEELKDLQEKAQKKEKKEQKEKSEILKQRLELQKRIRETLIAQVRTVEDAARVTAFLGRIEAQRLAASIRLRKQAASAANRLSRGGGADAQFRAAAVVDRLDALGQSTQANLLRNSINNPVVAAPGRKAPGGLPAQGGLINYKNVTIEEGAVQINAENASAEEIGEIVEEKIFNLVENAEI